MLAIWTPYIVLLCYGSEFPGYMWVQLSPPLELICVLGADAWPNTTLVGVGMVVQYVGITEV